MKANYMKVSTDVDIFLNNPELQVETGIKDRN